MATITEFSARVVQRGGTITVTGTGFGSSQGTGTILIGGIAPTSITWGATSIAGTIANTTPFGAADVVITPDGAAAVTADRALVVIDPTSNNSTSEIMITDTTQAVYVDGIHVGYVQGGKRFRPAMDTIDIMADNSLQPIDTRVLRRSGELSLTFAQINGDNLALALDADYDDPQNEVTNKTGTSVATHDVVLVYSSGIKEMFPKCQVLTPSELAYTPGQQAALSVVFRCLPNDDGIVFYLSGITS